METKKKIGKRLKDFREDTLKLTQHDLFEKTKILESNISKIESGKRKVQFNELIEFYKLGFPLIEGNTDEDKKLKLLQLFESLNDKAQDEVIETIIIKKKIWG